MSTSRASADESDRGPGQLTYAAQTLLVLAQVWAMIGIPAVLDENQLAAFLTISTTSLVVGLCILPSGRTRPCGRILVASALPALLIVGLVLLVDYLRTDV